MAQALKSRSSLLMQSTTTLYEQQNKALQLRLTTELGAITLSDDSARQKQFSLAAARYIKDYNAASFAYSLSKQKAWDSFLADSKLCQMR